MVSYQLKAFGHATRTAISDQLKAFGHATRTAYALRARYTEQLSAFGLWPRYAFE